METQQFHLKWNNHSLNTLSSFQNLLDTNTLVDVSLTCSNGKTVTAHRMVLAACSDYFYRLFKDLPEKHPVIVFKDASEEIVRDLLLFMYKGEVEVQEAYLNDFLKFADTLQVKGLSQSDRDQHQIKRDTSTPRAKSVERRSPATTIKPEKALLTPASMPPELTKSYLASAGLGKFAGLPFAFPPADPTAPELFPSLGSPNLYRALQRKYGHTPLAGHPESPILKQMPPFLKDMFKQNPDLAAAAMYPRDDNDNDSIAERSPPPSQHGDDRDEHNGTPMESDGGSPYPQDQRSNSELNSTTESTTNSQDRNPRTGGSKPAGRGSRLERMIAAEYKIMSEYSENTPEVLPVMTPELMKSRRTHSLQLAIGEILHNRASVQSAATKYHIPRETLRRHYQRYLKAMGIQKSSPSRPEGSTTTTVRTTNNNAKSHASLEPPTNDDNSASNGFSSLMDIGQAYGIWEAADLKARDSAAQAAAHAAALAHSRMVAAAAAAAPPTSSESDEKPEKPLVIDEEERRPVSPASSPIHVTDDDPPEAPNAEKKQPQHPPAPMETSA